jgi:hypothetical protein
MVENGASVRASAKFADRAARFVGTYDGEPMFERVRDSLAANRVADGETAGPWIGVALGHSLASLRSRLDRQTEPFVAEIAKRMP